VPVIRDLGEVMRKYIALIVGVAMLGAGLWGLEVLLLETERFRMLLLVGAAFLVFLGVCLVGATLREWNGRRSPSS
jgi:arginine exporter protein ArgO